MLKIFNDLNPFFEDNYNRIHVRQYAKILGISPPTASKLLNDYLKEGFLKKEEDKGYFHFFANQENKLFTGFQGLYYLEKFDEMIIYLKKELIHPVIILFGSFAKSEIIGQSDIDIAIFTPSKKKINLSEFEDKFGRKIQIFMFKDKIQAEKNPELFNNILNGFKLEGSW